MVKEVILEGRLPLGENLAFHVLFLTLSLTALASRREWLHKLFAAAMLGLFVVYVALLFARLG